VSALSTLLPLVHRSFIKSHRDIVAYGIRIAMYLGLAIMMGTVWLRLSPTQSNIQAFTNAIFFGGAFMSFMAVAYIPAYLEDLAIYSKERANGLYGPTAFMLANFIVGIPYLFLITVLFSVVSYWLGGVPTECRGILDVGTLAIPGPFGCRVFGCVALEPHSYFRCGACGDCVCEWALDVREWVHGAARYAECLLEVRLPLH